jgi:4'-phosphopantetheinyl transferase EntD
MRYALDVCSRADLLIFARLEQAFSPCARVQKQMPSDCSACARRELGARAIEDALRTTFVQALEPWQGVLRLGENASLAVLSSEDQQDHLLHPQEEEGLPPGAGAKKRLELAVGRAAVRRALRDLGQVPFPVLRGEQGEPIWQAGFTGSVTHCWPWTAAVLIRAGKRFAIGIDLESMEQAAVVDVSGVVCTPAELEWVRDGNCHERIGMIFSAKEAVYKALFPFCRRYIDFKEVELSWLSELQSFQVGFVGELETEFAGFGKCFVLSRRINRLVLSCLVHETGKYTLADLGLSPSRNARTS